MNSSSNKAINKPYPWKLAVYPLLELLFFIAANLADNLFLSFFLILLAGVFLSFSIHVFFHECVHARAEYPLAVNIIHTLFLGLPFDGYRVHHYNHHTYSNSAHDFSTTWQQKNGKKTAFKPCQYAFGWLRQLSRAIHEAEPFSQSLGDVAKIKARIEPQKIALFLFCILLAFIGLKTFVLYFALVYFGWAFSALHNYGQHPPLEEEQICTFAGKTYNLVTFNNGLHWEHHNKPGLSWDQLELDEKSERIKLPHLLQPCFS